MRSSHLRRSEFHRSCPAHTCIPPSVDPVRARGTAGSHFVWSMSIPLQRRRSYQTLLDGPSALAPSATATPHRKDRFELSAGHARSPKLDQDPFRALNRRLPRGLKVGRNWGTLTAAAACACLWILARRM